MSRGRVPRGVTLVELVLAIFLLGLIVAAVGPSVPSEALSGTGLSSAAFRVRADVVYARELAMQTGVNHGVNFLAGGPYVVYRSTLGNPVLDPLTQQPFSQDPATMGSVQVAADLQVEFDPFGRPVIGGGSSVVLNSGAGARMVRISPNTGLVEIP